MTIRQLKPIKLKIIVMAYNKEDAIEQVEDASQNYPFEVIEED